MLIGRNFSGRVFLVDRASSVLGTYTSLPYTGQCQNIQMLKAKACLLF